MWSRLSARVSGAVRSTLGFGLEKQDEDHVKDINVKLEVKPLINGTNGNLTDDSDSDEEPSQNEVMQNAKQEMKSTGEVPQVEVPQGEGQRPKTAVVANKTETYEVSKILDERPSKNGGMDFKVLWKGWGAKDSTWEAEDHLDNCKDLLNEFFERKKNSEAGPSSRNEEAGCSRQTQLSKSAAENDNDNDNSEDDEDQRYTISKLTAIRSCADGSRDLRVLWKGYKKATWEPEANLLMHCEDMVTDFLAKHAAKSTLPKNKKRITGEIATSAMFKRSKLESPKDEELTDDDSDDDVTTIEPTKPKDVTPLDEVEKP